MVPCTLERVDCGPAWVLWHCYTCANYLDAAQEITSRLTIPLSLSDAADNLVFEDFLGVQKACETPSGYVCDFLKNQNWKSEGVRTNPF